MAIFYCDLVSGNDANDGLTPATPKLTLNGVTALPTGTTDEVRVRGNESCFVQLSGVWNWTNLTKTIICIGADYSSEIAAGDYVCKSDLLREAYRVESVAYAGGNTTITLSFQTASAGWSFYVGDTVTGVTTYKITTLPTIAAQTINKSGYYTGTLNSYTRVDTPISGGWDAAYTAQTSMTIMYNTTATAIILKSYWKLSNFLILGYSTAFSVANYQSQYNIGVSRILVDCYALNQWSFAENCFYNDIGRLFTNIHSKYLYKNCKILNQKAQTNSGYPYIYQSTNGNFENCIIGSVLNNKAIFGAGNATHYYNLTGCTIYGFVGNRYMFESGTYSNLVNCNIYPINVAISNGLVNVSNSVIQDIGTTNGTIHNLGNASKYINCSFNLNVNKTGAGISTSGLMYGCSGVTLATTIQPTLVIFDYNDDVDVSNFNTQATTLLYDLDANIGNAIIYRKTANIRFNRYGYTTLSEDYYTGKTGTTGATNSVLHVVGKNTTACDFTNVDFVINKSNSYNLSFYAKGSGSYTLHWNILNGGQYLYAWQTQAINASTWTNITKAISASDWKMSGTATLVIRIPSQAKGTYALIDYIQLT